MPRVTQPLLTTIAASTWQDSHVVTPDGARWFGVDTVNAWTLGTPGGSPPCARGISAADFARLQGGTAQADGSFLDASGAQWHLAPSTVGSMVVAEPGPEPDPG